MNYKRDLLLYTGFFKSHAFRAVRPPLMKVSLYRNPNIIELLIH